MVVKGTSPVQRTSIEAEAAIMTPSIRIEKVFRKFCLPLQPLTSNYPDLSRYTFTPFSIRGPLLSQTA